MLFGHLDLTFKNIRDLFRTMSNISDGALLRN